MPKYVLKDKTLHVTIGFDSIFHLIIADNRKPIGYNIQEILTAAFQSLL